MTNGKTRGKIKYTTKSIIYKISLVNSQQVTEEIEKK